MKIKKNQNIRKISLGLLFGFAFFGILVSPILASEMTFAEGEDPCDDLTSTDASSEVCVKVVIDEVLSMTINNSTATQTVDLGSGVSTEANISSAQSVRVSTNAYNGYTLTIKALGVKDDITDDTEAYTSTNKLARSATAVSGGISTVGSRSQYSTIKGQGAWWGWAVNNSNIGVTDMGSTDATKYFRPMPTADGKIMSYATGVVDEDLTSLYFGAEAGSGLVAGTYYNVVQLTAVANQSAVSYTSSSIYDGTN